MNKVKYFGFLPLTKKQYLIIQIIAFIIIIAIIIVTSTIELPSYFYNNIILKNIPLIFTIIFFIEIIDLVIMLKKFKKINNS
jgi:hypothetical protein